MDNHDHPISDAKLNANRLNAQHSTGPRTSEGKARSRLNATRHGLTGQVHVTTEEDRKAHDSHCESFARALQPQDAPEKHLVQTVADKQWQMHHAAAMFQSMYAIGQADLADQIDVAHPQVHDALTAGLFTMERIKEIELISRYASRLQRDYHNALKDLQAMQAQRKQREQQEMKEAIQIKKVCEMENEPFEPARFGFVLRTKQIETQILRERYLEKAAIAAKVRFNRERYREAVGN